MDRGSTQRREREGKESPEEPLVALPEKWGEDDPHKVIPIWSRE